MWTYTIFAALVLAGVMAFGYAAWRSSRAPESSPARFRDRPRAAGELRVVCVGDSLTHGVVSHDWVRALERRLGPPYTLINAGVNGDLAYNVRMRLDPIVACDPDVVEGPVRDAARGDNGR